MFCLICLRHARYKAHGDIALVEHISKYKPVRQKKRCIGTDRQRVAEEVDKLLEVRFNQVITYPKWLRNVVMVMKNKRKWRMCVYFFDLNKACLKKCFPLAQIDHLVDSALGYQLITFMDAFFGDNQILMADDDKEKTTFITESSTYYYRVILFGLKNAGATDQRLVNKVFKHQISQNIEVYVDDMLVKSARGNDHTRDLHETFAMMKEF